MNEDQDLLPQPSALSEADARDYLIAHPDFFLRHPEALEHLRLAHDGGNGTISLIEYQVQRLRAQLNHERKRIESLLDIARENELLQDRLHRIILTLLAPMDPRQKLDSLEKLIKREFSADAVRMHLFPSTVNAEEHRLAVYFHDFIERGQPLCGLLDKERKTLLFKGTRMSLQSMALIPLSYDAQAGILAIASKDPTRFNARQSTDFLTRLGEILSYNLPALKAP